MRISQLAKEIEDLGGTITSVAQCFVCGNVDCHISFTMPQSGESKESDKESSAVNAENALEKQPTFLDVRDWCDKGIADRKVKIGDKFILPALKVPSANCDGVSFDEIDLKDVAVIAVHVEARRVVFNFEDVLFCHSVDPKCSGSPFESTPLGVYLAIPFAKALEESAGKVKVSLLSESNVFNEDDDDFMPYFKPIKNRIKVLASENDTHWWWLKTPRASNSSNFCFVRHNGYSGIGNASAEGGVAPAFEFTAESV